MRILCGMFENYYLGFHSTFYYFPSGINLVLHIRQAANESPIAAIPPVEARNFRREIPNFFELSEAISIKRCSAFFAEWFDQSARILHLKRSVSELADYFGQLRIFESIFFVS